jgi:hypothetical protein
MKGLFFRILFAVVATSVFFVEGASAAQILACVPPHRHKQNGHRTNVWYCHTGTVGCASDIPHGNNCSGVGTPTLWAVPDLHPPIYITPPNQGCGNVVQGELDRIMM